MDLNNIGVDIEAGLVSLDFFKACMQRVYDDPKIADSFSSNQMISKQSLFDMIEKHNLVDANTTVVVFGSWYGSLIVPHLAPRVRQMVCVDLDDKVTGFAKNSLFPKLTNVHWIAGDVFASNHEIYKHLTGSRTLFINTSCEHMPPMNKWPWRKNYVGAHFIFQSNDMFYIDDHSNCVKDIEEFIQQAPGRVYDTESIEDSRGTRFTIVGKFTDPTAERLVPMCMPFYYDADGVKHYRTKEQTRARSQGLHYTYDDFILPCCHCSLNRQGLDDLLTDDLKVSNNEDVYTILADPKWMDFIDTIMHRHEEAPPVCHMMCGADDAK